MSDVEFKKTTRVDNILIYDYNVIVGGSHVATFRRTDNKYHYCLVDKLLNPILTKVTKKEHIATRQNDFWPIYEKAKGIIHARV